MTGTITYKGKPVNGGALILYEANGKGDTISIPVSQEGTFRAGDLPLGEYKIVVQPSVGMAEHTKGLDKGKLAQYQSKMDEMKSPPTIPIPEKYKQRTNTTLTLTVVQGEQTKNLELTD